MANGDISVFVELERTAVLAGRLFAHHRGNVDSATFTYDSTYVANPRAYALDPALPLVAAPAQTGPGQSMFGAFGDSAPDRWGRRLLLRGERRRADAARETARSFGEMDFLLGVRDDLRQGAVRFAATGGGWLSDQEDGIPHLVRLHELLGLSDAIERDAPDIEALTTLIQAGSSLGGARPKANVIDADGSVCIAKFPRPDLDQWDVVRWERVALSLAQRAGIRVAESKLVPVSGRGVLLVRRFDRVRGSRIGYVSAMTMLEARDGDSRSYVDIAEVLEEDGSMPVVDLCELWRRLVFGVLIRNTDDHLRNHGFLRSGVGWRLSPAFDINPNPEPGNGTLSTSIDGSTDEARLDVALEVAGLFRLSNERAREIVAEVALAVQGWVSVAAEHNCKAPEIARMRSAFEHRETERARELVA